MHRHTGEKGKGFITRPLKAQRGPKAGNACVFLAALRVAWQLSACARTVDREGPEGESKQPERQLCVEVAYGTGALLTTLKPVS